MQTAKVVVTRCRPKWQRRLTMKYGVLTDKEVGKDKG